MTTARPLVLIVDDDPFIRRPLQYLLEKNGYETVLAGDGIECLEQAESRRPDLVCLDVMMPRQDGFVTTGALRNRFGSSLPIILLTAKGQEADRARGLALGADDFLSKPYSPVELLARIRSALANAGTELRDGGLPAGASHHEKGEFHV